MANPDTAALAPPATSDEAAPPPEKHTGLWVFVIVFAAMAVICLAVLVAVVGLRQRHVSEAAQLSNLRSNLQTIRSQLLLYQVQHNEMYPTALERQLTLYTDIAGGTAGMPDGAHPFGPYIMKLPVNPVSGSKAIRMVEGAMEHFEPPCEDAGWYFNTTTGEFRADLPDSRVAPNGDKYNAL